MRAVLIAVMILASTGVAGAADLNLPPGSWWENERLVERIGLAPQQQEAIGELVYDHALRMIDLTAEVKRAEFELEARVRRDELDAEAVRAAFRGFQEARRALETERFEMLLAVRQVLTTRQWELLQSMRRERMRRQHEGDGPRRPGAGDAPRPHRPGVPVPPGGGR